MFIVICAVSGLFMGQMLGTAHKNQDDKDSSILAAQESHVGGP